MAEHIHLFLYYDQKILLNNNSPHKFNHNASRETDNISRDILTKANIKDVEFATGRKLNDGVTVCVYVC